MVPLKVRKAVGLAQVGREGRLKELVEGSFQGIDGPWARSGVTGHALALPAGLRLVYCAPEQHAHGYNEEDGAPLNGLRM